MKINQILNSSECKVIFDEVKLFVNKSLSEYNSSIANSEMSFLDKDIFDFVWGTVNFSAAEMCILDSPLLQRLRHIRQLGLASTVYCNADSSRFSHTIGVTEVAGRMARAITKNVKDILGHNDFVEYSNFDPEEVVRLAAIFHDVGHMFFSHVSELFFSRNKDFPRYGEVTRAISFFCQKTSAEISLHELLSVMIVNSPATIDLLKLASNFMNKTRLTKTDHYEMLTELISSLIIGVPINKYILPYSMIINSAIDADKLDYLSRDSQCTKVPIAVDISRIIQKLDVVNTDYIEQTDIWQDSSSNTVPYKIMAIKNSAKNVFFQLSNARLSMYESVYYHHKVLTAETMFRDGLHKLYTSKNIDKAKFNDILELTDDTFNNYWEYAFYPIGKTNTNEINEISKIFTYVRERNLYKRVAAFSHEIIIAPKAIKEDFLNNIIKNPLSEDCKLFGKRLAEEYTKICKILNIHYYNADPQFMFIYSAYNPISSMPIEKGDGYCIWSSNLMKQETMEAGKKSKQEQFYLVTNCKDRLPVYLALERVITEFGINSLTVGSTICSKLSQNALNNKRNELLEKDYYHDILNVLHDDFLIEKVYDKILFSHVIDKYRSFMGAENCKITKDRLLNYLRQFLRFDLSFKELKALSNGILQLLNAAYYLDRDTFSKQFSLLLNNKLSKLQSKNKFVVLLGGLKDSAHHWSYYINDVGDKNSIIMANNIETALDSCTEKDCICFFDDGAYSGKQVISIFQELLGLPLEQRTTNEHHVNELNDKNKKKLKNTKIVLSYLCFNKTAETYIISELKKLGINNIEIHYITDLSQKILESKDLFNDENQQKIVEKYLKIVGTNLLEATKKIEDSKYKSGWSKERITNSALGYNNAQQTIIFYYNVPTYTITALWANGNTNFEWEGLFQRTNKD